MPAAPRTDPYVKNYLIRLLPLVGREIAHADRDGGFEVAASNDSQGTAFVTREVDRSDYVAEADAATYAPG